MFGNSNLLLPQDPDNCKTCSSETVRPKEIVSLAEFISRSSQRTNSMSW
jgi:hypothetical protein